ncbi:MAG: polysaccharide deacetylase [Mesorhizobium sp.]|uniref:polysaccharide deacetylase family protein n=1 Tax=Mesorhizobium sp. TaxID=1871066 RepID=UPI000FE6C487|nr:polysaccharide deacetylase [Mesorhizobium sp.]RWI50274.1 MAG: polysaccharide deacetylase [Mesorhizobium sp.]
MKPSEPHEWTEAEWRQRVGLVRAGRPLRPSAWPGGAKCAVALSFDSDHETSELKDGGNSIGRLSWGEYGSRVGVPRILDILRRNSIPSTFFVPAVTALLHPDEQRAVVAEGHEVGLHGWIHEFNTALPPEIERELLFRSSDALERATGVRPVGLRTPSWDVSSATIAAEKELGLLYDSSLMADEDCYEILLDGIPSGLVEIPVEWIRDDAPYFFMNRHSNLRPYTAPADVFDIFRREFELAHAAGGLFQLTMHPHVISYRSRIWILEELISTARSKGDVWFATHADVARWVLDNAEAPPAAVVAAGAPSS